MAISWDDVEEAVQYVLTPEVNQALKKARIPLPERLKMAILKAFVNEDCYQQWSRKIMREAQTNLDTIGTVIKLSE